MVHSQRIAVIFQSLNISFLVIISSDRSLPFPLKLICLVCRILSPGFKILHFFPFIFILTIPMLEAVPNHISCDCSTDFSLPLVLFDVLAKKHLCVCVWGGGGGGLKKLSLKPVSTPISHTSRSSIYVQQKHTSSARFLSLHPRHVVRPFPERSSLKPL